MRVVLIPLTYPLHYKRLLAFTMFPAWNTFNPVPTTPQYTQTPPRPVCRCLSFSSADNYTPDSTPVCSDSSDEEEEDFQMVPLDDEHWTSEETPERTFCIHKHGLPHGLCQYPCPYENYNTLHTWTVWI